MSFRRWLPTFLGFPIGGYLATQIVGSLHDPASAAAGGLVADVMLWGLVTGATVGAAQSALLATGPRVAAAWAAVNAVGWSLGWLVTSGVIVDIERGTTSSAPAARCSRRSSPAWRCGTCSPPPGPPRP